MRACTLSNGDLDDDVEEQDEISELANADELAIDDRARRDELLVSDVITKADLHLASDENVEDILDRLAGYSAMVDTHAMTQARFDDLQQANGFKHEPRGLLRIPDLKRHLQPTRQFAHDPMHVLAVHGVINVCMYLCINAWTLQPLGLSWETVRGYLDSFY